MRQHKQLTEKQLINQTDMDIICDVSICLVSKLTTE